MNGIHAPSLSKDLLVKEVLDTELGTIYFYDNILVMEGKQNVTINIQTGLSILLKVINIIGLKPVVYISNRINSYSVDPNDYQYLETIPNLKGIGVVTYNHLTTKTVKLEQKFFSKPFKAFEDLNDAKLWALEMIEGRAT